MGLHLHPEGLHFHPEGWVYTSTPRVGFTLPPRRLGLHFHPNGLHYHPEGLHFHTEGLHFHLEGLHFHPEGWVYTSTPRVLRSGSKSPDLAGFLLNSESRKKFPDLLNLKNINLPIVIRKLKGKLAD